MLLPATSAGPTLAAGTHFQIGPLERLEIAKPADAFTEVSPRLLPGGLGLMLSTAWSYRCRLASIALANDCSGARLFTFGDAHRHAPDAMPDRPWRRNYQGVFSAELLDGALVTFNHAENKNEVIGGRRYMNTVQPVPGCFSGYAGGAYQECWSAYSGFVTATRGRRDLGPVVWPEKGYLWPNGERASNGLRHPHSLRWGDYVYLFYVDTDWPLGERAGIRVARAPADRHGQGFRVYHGGEWIPALPRGFSKGRMARYYATPGSRSTPLLGLGKNTATFQVARWRGGFLGVEQFWNDAVTRTAIALRASNDLVHWSPRAVLPVPAAGVEDFPLFYPVLLNARGTTHSRVGDRFYLLGTRGGQVNRLTVWAG